MNSTPIQQSFEISWASADEKKWLLKRLVSLKRQTMNIRLMQDARFVILKSDGVPIGWGGLDISFQREYPELFSLSLDPEFRNYSLGGVIELARASFLLSQGVRFAFVRMTDDSAGVSLLSKRLNSQFYERIDPSELKSEYVQLCRNCELYQSTCRRNVFLKFDVQKFFAHSVTELGAVPDNLPRQFRIIRVGEQRKISGDHGEKTHIWNSYRPLWLNF